MGKLSSQDEAALAALLAKKDAPDDVDEVWIKDGNREYRVAGGTAAKVLDKLFGDTPPAKKAPRKAAPPPADDDQDDGDNQDDGDDPDGGDPPEETDPPPAKKHWYFGA